MGTLFSDPVLRRLVMGIDMKPYQRRLLSGDAPWDGSRFSETDQAEFRLFRESVHNSALPICALSIEQWSRDLTREACQIILSRGVEILSSEADAYIFTPSPLPCASDRSLIERYRLSTADRHVLSIDDVVHRQGFPIFTCSVWNESMSHLSYRRGVHTAFIIGREKDDIPRRNKSREGGGWRALWRVLECRKDYLRISSAASKARLLRAAFEEVERLEQVAGTTRMLRRLRWEARRDNVRADGPQGRDLLDFSP